MADPDQADSAVQSPPAPPAAGQATPRRSRLVVYDSQGKWTDYLVQRLLPDLLFSLRNWRVWVHLGMRAIRHQYRRSLLGAMWMFVHLAVFALAVGLVYGRLFGRPAGAFLPYLLLGFNIWGLIRSSVVEGGSAFLTSEGYIKQIAFPKQVYLLRNMVVYVVNSLAGFIIYLAMVPILGIPIGWGMLWALPGMAIVCFCCLAHVWIMAYLSARFRDLSHAVNSIFQVLYFVMPIIYPEEMLADRGLGWVFQLNPLFWLMVIVRHPLLHSAAPHLGYYLQALGYGVVLWAAALVLGAKLDRKVVYWL